MKKALCGLFGTPASRTIRGRGAPSFFRVLCEKGRVSGAGVELLKPRPVAKNATRTGHPVTLYATRKARRFSELC